jgi:hypothetical protein
VFGRQSSDQLWAEACAEADRLDPGWRWEDLLARRPILPADRDATQVIQEAAARLSPAYEREFERELDQIPRNESLSSSAASALHAALTQATDAHRLARQLPELAVSRLPDCERPVINHLPLDSITCNRRVAVLLKLHAVLAAECNEIDEALADSRAMLAVAEAASEPPMLITILVTIAIRNLVVESIERSLAQGEPSIAALESMQRCVENSRAAQTLLEGMRGERAINEEFLRQFDSGRVSRWQLTKLEFFDAIFRIDWRGFYKVIGVALFGGHNKRYTAEIVRYYTALIEMLKDSPERAEITLPASSPTVQRSLQSVARVISADRRTRAKLSSLACALAAERFRLCNGCWPSTIGDLVPVFLSSVPLDPYDLQPLHYSRIPDGVVIDTIGLDDNKEGGKFHDAGSENPADIGIRLWSPEFRRKPPPAT